MNCVLTFVITFVGVIVSDVLTFVNTFFNPVFRLFFIGFLCRQKRCACLILREMKRLIDQHSDSRMLVSL